MAKVTKESIILKIKKDEYQLIAGTTTTLCLLTLTNGFVIVGKSACVDINNFDAEMGRKIAYEDAFDKIWELEGYLLAETSCEPTSDDAIAIIAMTAHEVNRAYCYALGDKSQVPWAEASDWQRYSAINGVKAHMANPHMTPEQSHNNWMLQKEREGWVFGPEKIADTKEHPCMLPFHQLPIDQQVKDHLFKAVVTTLAGQ